MSSNCDLCFQTATATKLVHMCADPLSCKFSQMAVNWRLSKVTGHVFSEDIIWYVASSHARLSRSAAKRRRSGMCAAVPKSWVARQRERAGGRKTSIFNPFPGIKDSALVLGLGWEQSGESEGRERGKRSREQSWRRLKGKQSSPATTLAKGGDASHYVFHCERLLFQTQELFFVFFYRV